MIKNEPNNCSVGIKNEQIKNHEVFQSTMNLPICLNFVYEKWTDNISHSSSRISTHSYKRFYEMLTTTISTAQTPRSTVTGLITQLND